MKYLAIIFALTLSAAAQEHEVWYNADGEPVRVIEEKGKPEGIYVPPWQRRENDKQSYVNDGKIRWDTSRTSGRWYSRDRYIYPGWYGGWAYPRYHCYRPHYRYGYGYRGGIHYRGNGVRVNFTW